jgi:hypothetical protein
MNADELRDAIRRVLDHAAKCEADRHHQFRCELDAVNDVALDGASIARRLLELLPPADDGELLTEDWLRSLRDDRVRGGSWYWIVCGVDYEPHAEWPGGPIRLEPESPGMLKPLVDRGDLRRVVLALTGIPLCEGQ